MSQRVAWRIAAPMTGMGLVLLALGIFAAFKVQDQQQTSSDLIAREVTGMVVIEELNLKMREIRYQINLFLRSPDRGHLTSAERLLLESGDLLSHAQTLARGGREESLIGVVVRGCDHFRQDFAALSAEIAARGDAGDAALGPAQTERLRVLSDELLTNEVLKPLEECIAADQQMVEKTTAASQRTAQHLKVGFLLLGICGGAAGLLMGTGIARAVRKSIVRLDVTVRGMTGKLADIAGPVSFSHIGDLAGIESSLRHVEDNISGMVEQLQQRETEALRNEQLARVGQLAAGLAHELRNPLMPMKMLVQAAIERGPDAGLTGRSLQVLNDEITRLEKAIQEFLDFARPPAPDAAETDVVELIGQTTNLVQGRAHSQAVDIRLKTPPQAVIAQLDGGQIRQLVLNLLLNALDALAGSGVIDVELSPDARPATPLGEPMPAAHSPIDSAGLTEHDALRIISSVRQAADAGSQRWLAIRVADNGPGIAENVLANIFEPFITTKDTGIGLGLSNCQRIAAAHAGTLTARNRPQGGAEFVLTLPYRPTDSSAKAPTATPSVTRAAAAAFERFTPS